MRETDMLFIPEGDLCRLAAKSELPGASEFESWIFDEVIPAILRTGTYFAVPVQPHRPVEVSPGGMAKLILANRRVMLDMGCSFVEVGAASCFAFFFLGMVGLLLSIVSGVDGRLSVNAKLGTVFIRALQGQNSL